MEHILKVTVSITGSLIPPIYLFILNIFNFLAVVANHCVDLGHSKRYFEMFAERALLAAHE